MATTSTDIQRAAALIRSGGTVAFPTETVYGLGANALSAEASARIFEIKERPHFNPLIVHVPTLEAALALSPAFPRRARALAERFWPGPLTLIVPKPPAIPDIVTAGLPTMAVRVPRHPMALALLTAAGVPIAAPSANLFSTISPSTAAHVEAQLGGKIDLILDGGPCEVGLESTIVAVEDDGPARLLRPGGLSREAIEAVIGKLEIPGRSSNAPLAPGMLDRHYAPGTPMIWRDTLAGAPPPKTGLITLQEPSPGHGFAHIEALSPAGDLNEAARNLFAALRRLDGAGLALIVAERFPDTGLGYAINDRLTRGVR